MALSWTVVAISLLIMVARMVDVTLGTLRMFYVAKHRTNVVFVVALVEMIIWVFAVAALVRELDEPLHAFAFALGYAIGTVLGIRLEQRIATGDQVLRVFSRKGSTMAGLLRDKGARVTVFTGEGRDGPIDLLYVGSRRRGVQHLIEIAREHDPACFFTVDDLRRISAPRPGAMPGGMASGGASAHK